MATQVCLFCKDLLNRTLKVCVYCMKEFSRGKNEKDLSTSCLMRHVRRAHPTVLVEENGSAPAPAPLPAPLPRLPPPPTDAGDPGTVLSPGKLVPRTASKSPSPHQVTEELGSVVSSEEAPSDVSVSERYTAGMKPWRGRLPSPPASTATSLQRTGLRKTSPCPGAHPGPGGGLPSGSTSTCRPWTTPRPCASTA